MIIIIDTNILISALIRDSTVREILINSGLRFYYPEASFHEVRKHKAMILEKSGLGDAEFEGILGKILEYVALVPTENIREHLEEARAVMGHIDPKDVAFLAAALSYEPSMIWSDDRDFERQDRIKVVKTAQLRALIIPMFAKPIGSQKSLQGFRKPAGFQGSMNKPRINCCRRPSAPEPSGEAVARQPSDTSINYGCQEGFGAVREAIPAGIASVPRSRQASRAWNGRDPLRGRPVNQNPQFVKLLSRQYGRN